jgi:3-deoxy-D-manno-octulosonic-acid transferase
MRDLIIAVILVLASPLWLILLIIKPHWRAGLIERFKGPEDNVDLWLHGASMGELMGVEVVLKQFHEKYPDKKILVTSNTQTGRYMAQKKFPFASVQLAPFDWGPVMKGWMKNLNPQLHVLSELDLWPARQKQLLVKNIPTVVLGARLSDRGMKRSQKIWGLLHTAYNSVDFWGSREEAVSLRLKTLGIPDDKIQITGPLKYDILLEKKDSLELKGRFDSSLPTLIAGSIHPGEERPFIELHQKTRDMPELQIILVPRHPQKLNHFKQELKRLSCPYVLWSDEKPMATKGFLLVDVLGVLAGLYEKGSLAFVGGTFVNLGGHNVLEPARFSCPLVVGPHTHHVAEEMAVLLEKGAVLQTPKLCSELENLLKQPEKASAMGAASHEALLSLCGGSEKSLKIIEKYFEDH